MNSRNFKDIFMRYFHFFIGIINIIIAILIFLFIFINSLSFFKNYSMKDFFLGKEWISLSNKFGILPLLTGSFWVTFIALTISIIFGIISSIYIAEFSSGKIKAILKISIETMAAIPSVVLGYLGLTVISTLLQSIFNIKNGLNALNGGIMLSFMALPTIITLSSDAINSLDHSYKEASLALGANKLETIFKILLPSATPGIFAGIILGFGRVIGETMAVLMITGNSPIIATTPLSSVRTLTATIAAEMGEVVQGGVHYNALFAIALILFIISFITNSLADIYIRKSRIYMKR